MTAVPAVLDVGPGGVEADIAEAYALVRAFDADDRGPLAGDPHAEFAALRERGAVHRSTLERVFLGAEVSGADVSGADALPVWHVVSYAAAERVLRDEQAFSSSAYDDSMGRVIGRSFLEMDGHEHRVWKNALHGGFHRHKVPELRARLRTDLVSRLRLLADRGGGDLVAEVAFPAALTTIADLIGFPPGTRVGTLYTWAVGLLDDTDGKIAGAMADWLGTPSAWPADSLVGRLLRCDDPEVGTGAELLPAVRLLLSTGTEPPFRSLATLMYVALADPRVLETVRRDASRASAVIEECRRWESPLTWALRRCVADTELYGERLGAGDLVCVNLASANRDGRRWARADRFDPDRPPRPHLAMGTGPHICLGRHLAALEAGELVDALLRVTATGRLPGVVLETDGVSGRGFRSPRRLVLRW
ncbi:cytochrome P450 [Streptomyces sp. NPDC001595]|uniref:cytochrome P450 n=1 Tax=Streptomyces sp. NPDC001532 TaxID=3154520 RepID=UPI0033184D41